MVKYIENIGKEDTVEDVEEIVNALCLGMTSGVKAKNNKLKDYSLKKLDIELLQVNQRQDVFQPDIIELTAVGKKAKIKRIIKKIMRKVIRPVLFNQVVFNAHTASALNEVREIININEADRHDISLPDDFYLKFEEKFRGSSEEISKRVALYADIFGEGKRILDIGCGRGELLDLLQKKSSESYGIDVNSEMVRICREKGLNAVVDEAIGHLNKVADNTLDGIAAIQVVEHLDSASLLELMRLANRKLKQDGTLIIETCNPMTLGVYSYGFYIDPTHSKPVHPAMLRFMAEYCGFNAERYELLNAFPDEYKLSTTLVEDHSVKEDIDKINDLLFGAQDYMYVFKK